jgi:LPS O-antigen subunit length determinant protein (WzzB/FepE family)
MSEEQKGKEALPQISAILHPNWHQQHNDEIDLAEILRKLWTQKTLIIVLVCLGTLGAFVGTKMMPKSYNVEAAVNQPSLVNVAPFVKYGLKIDEIIPAQQKMLLAGQGVLVEPKKKSLSVASVYLQAFDLMQNISLREQAFVDLNMAEKLGISAEMYKSSFYDFQGSFNVSKERPTWLELDKKEKTPLARVLLSIDTRQPEVVKEYINHFLALVNQRLIEQLTSAQKMQKEINHKALTLRFDTLLSSVEAVILAEKSELEKALVAANSLDIKGLDMGYVARSVGQEIPLYMYGSSYLVDQIALLNKKLTSLAGLGQLSLEALSELSLLNTDDSMVFEIREISALVRVLNAATLDFSNSAVMVIEQPAYVPNRANGPNVVLILLAALVLSFMFAVFVALLKLVLRK